VRGFASTQPDERANSSVRCSTALRLSHVDDVTDRPLGVFPIAVSSSDAASSSARSVIGREARASHEAAADCAVVDGSDRLGGGSNRVESNRWRSAVSGAWSSCRTNSGTTAARLVTAPLRVLGGALADHSQSTYAAATSSSVRTLRLRASEAGSPDAISNASPARCARSSSERKDSASALVGYHSECSRLSVFQRTPYRRRDACRAMFQMLTR